MQGINCYRTLIRAFQGNSASRLNQDAVRHELKTQVLRDANDVATTPHENIEIKRLNNL